MLNINTKENWRRPFTPKRYLHGPFSEYLYTLWADMKLLCGPVVEKTCGYRSAGVKLLLGQELVSPEFEAVQTIAREDGLPLHALRYETQDIRIDMEAFCSTGSRVPSGFLKLTVTNRTHRTYSDQLALLPRTGREDHLVGMEVDGYAHFDGNEHNWGFLETNWAFTDGCRMSDGEYEILLGDCDFTPVWQGDEDGLVWYQRRLLCLVYTLAPKQSRTLTLRLRPAAGASEAFCYDTERAAAEDFWQRQLARIHCVPDSEAHLDIVRNLTVQSLQMFSYPVGKDYVLARQGGLQRIIWPAEAWEFLVMLNKMGDFGEYTETAYDTYFDILTVSGGEDDGYLAAANGWACHTAAAVLACSDYLICSGSRRVYEKYAEKLYRAFCWMQRKRQSTYEMDCIGKGIFPPMKSSDWPGEYQSRCITDCTNLQGYDRLAEAFAQYHDPRAQEIRDAHTDYMTCMRRLLDAEVAKNTRGDEILLTNKIGVELTDPPSGPYFDDGPRDLLLAGVMDANSETMEKAERYFRRRGCMRNGLTGLMNDGLIFQGHNADPWAGHTWYTSSGDKGWFFAWLKRGEHEKARQTLEAQMYYGMTNAYYMMERYADNDPYWVPWCPNASANGRLLQMLFAFYGEKEI